MKKRLLSMVLMICMMLIQIPAAGMPIDNRDTNVSLQNIIGSGDTDEEPPSLEPTAFIGRRAASITISGDYVAANGIPIVIRQNGSITSVYDGVGDLLSGDTDVKDKWILGGTLSGDYTGDTSITVESGTLTARLFGGNYSGTINGNTHIVINGGTVRSVYGGNTYSGVVTGNTYVAVNAGTVTGWFYGGGAGYSSTEITEVRGSTNINITGGALQQNVYGGGGWLGAKVGSANISITGGTVAYGVYGGGEEASTTGSVHITIGGNADVGTVFAGGAGFNDTNATVTGTSSVRVQGGTVAYGVYGSGGGYTDQTSAIVGAVDVTITRGNVSHVVAICNFGGSATVSGDFSLTVDNVVMSGNVVMGCVGDSNRTMRNVALHLKGTAAGSYYTFPSPITGSLDILIEDTFCEIHMSLGILQNATSSSLTYKNCGAVSNTAWTRYTSGSVYSTGQNPLVMFDDLNGNKFNAITLSNCYMDYKENAISSSPSSYVAAATDQLVIEGGALRCYFTIDTTFPPTSFVNNPTLIYSYPVRGGNFGTSSLFFPSVSGKAKLRLMNHDGNPDSDVAMNSTSFFYCEAIKIPLSANAPSDTFTLDTVPSQADHYLAYEDKNIYGTGGTTPYSRWSIVGQYACRCVTNTATVNPTQFDLTDTAHGQVFTIIDTRLENAMDYSSQCPFADHRAQGLQTAYAVQSHTTASASITGDQLTVSGAGKVVLTTTSTAGFASSAVGTANIYTVYKPSTRY